MSLRQLSVYIALPARLILWSGSGLWRVATAFPVSGTAPSAASLFPSTARSIESGAYQGGHWPDAPGSRFESLAGPRRASASLVGNMSSGNRPGARTSPTCTRPSDCSPLLTRARPALIPLRVFGLEAKCVCVCVYVTAWKHVNYELILEPNTVAPTSALPVPGKHSSACCGHVVLSRS